MRGVAMEKENDDLVLEIVDEFDFDRGITGSPRQDTGH